CEDCEQEMEELNDLALEVFNASVSSTDVLSRLESIGEGTKPLQRYVTDWIESEQELEYIISEYETFRSGPVSWMSSNCPTQILPSELEIALCGLVVDCSALGGCAIGLPVVNEPELVYLPFAMLEPEEAEALFSDLGVTYDVEAGILDMGFMNKLCGWTTESAVVCASTGLDYCRVVNCGHNIIIEPQGIAKAGARYNSETDDVIIWGNILTW
ncbi:MAG: hypothetical protein GOU99_00715, partial [Candidatus Altiarchaeota archaeon]|nr:hypothetical protein [Candidatus Altiarchaeota archaeon]